MTHYLDRQADLCTSIDIALSISGVVASDISETQVQRRVSRFSLRIGMLAASIRVQETDETADTRIRFRWRKTRVTPSGIPSEGKKEREREREEDGASRD